ncbi:MAG: acyltransferase [Opitutus sp.]|nr:acyltransferase [Opitutus sp.]
MSSPSPSQTRSDRSRSAGASGKITEFDGLRALLAMLVVSSHLLIYSGVTPGMVWKPLRWLTMGGMAVDVFIILSGFVIFLLLDRARETPGVYLWRRFMRLFPAYLCCLAIGIALSPVAADWLRALPWHGQDEIVRLIRVWESATAHFSAHLFMHLTMLHGVLPDEILPHSGTALLGVAWSLSLEWQFYLVAPLAYAMIRRPLGAWFWGGAIIGSTVFAAFIKSRYAGEWALTYRPGAFLPLKAHLFFVGGVSYFAHRALVKARFRMPRAMLPAALTGVVLFVDARALWIWFTVLAAHWVARSHPVDTASRFVCGVLNSSFLQRVGLMSYSVYILHTAFIYVWSHALVLLPVTWTRWTFLAVLTMLVLPSIWVGASLLYRYVERPAIEFAKRRHPLAWRSSPTLAPG